MEAPSELVAAPTPSVEQLLEQAHRRIQARREGAGRSELGRLLAIADTDLEKLRVWLAAISSNGIDLG